MKIAEPWVDFDNDACRTVLGSDGVVAEILYQCNFLANDSEFDSSETFQWTAYQEDDWDCSAAKGESSSLEEAKRECDKALVSFGWKLLTDKDMALL